MAALAEPDTSSKHVLKAQKLLNQNAKASIVKEDGMLNRETIKAIKAFQKSSGLRETGVLDKSIMDIMQKAVRIENPTKQITVGGKVYLFTDKDYQSLLARSARAVEPAMRSLKRAIETARFYWDFHKKLRNDQYIISWCIELASPVGFPDESVIKAAETEVKNAESALKSLQLARFSAAFQKATPLVDKASVAIKKYAEGVQSGGVKVITGLTYIKGSAFVLLSTMSAPVSAGFSAGAIAANVVKLAGPAAVEALADEIAKGTFDKKDGGKAAAASIAKDTMLNVACSKIFKGKYATKATNALVGQVSKKLPGKLAKKLSGNAAKKFTENYFKEHSSDIVEGIIKEELKKANSLKSPVKADTFLETVGKQVITQGHLSKFDAGVSLTPQTAKRALGSKAKTALVKAFGNKRPSTREMDGLIGQLLAQSEKQNKKAFDKTFIGLSTREDEKKIRTLLVKELFGPKTLAQAPALVKNIRR